MKTLQWTPCVFPEKNKQFSCQGREFVVTDFRENILFLPVGLASNYHRECHQIRKYVIDRITFCRRACCCELSTFPKHPIQPAKKKRNNEWISYLYENLSSSSLLQWSRFIKQRNVTVLRPKPIKGQLSWLGVGITDDNWGSQFFPPRYLFMLVFHFHAPICLNQFFLLFARSIFPLTPILISLFIIFSERALYETWEVFGIECGISCSVRETTEAIVCESSSVRDKLALFRAPFCSLSFSSFRGASL